MKLPGGVLRSLEGGGLMFFCLGCNGAHAIAVGEGPGPRWGWNGSTDKPTFTPSIRVTYPGPDAGSNGAPPALCHSFINDGRMQYLADCTHALAGQTVELPAHWAEGN